MLNFRRGNGYQKFKVRRTEHDIKTEDIFLDAAMQKKKERYKSPGYGQIETALSQKTFTLVYGVFLLVIIFFGVFSFYLQTFKHDFYAEKSEKNRYISGIIEAERGIIYDKNFNQLVSNTQVFSLACNFSDLPEDQDLFKSEVVFLSRLLGISENEIMQKIENEKNKNNNQTIIFNNLDIDKIIILETKKETLPGFNVIKESTRNYADAESLSLLLGFVSRDSKSGQLGLEKQYDEYLKEVPGIFEKIRKQADESTEEKIVKAPEPGNNLVLNIDMDLQKKISEFLKQDLADYKAKAGSVVVLDPNTGAVLSLVSLPSFDSNIFSKTLSAEDYNKMINSANTSFYNRSIAGEYPIGSTIKPIIASAALQEGIITAQTIINDDKGGLLLGDGTFKKDWAVHGLTDLNKAIAESCDTYFYMVGGGYQNFKGLGIDKIDYYLNDFGLGEITGIDIPGETSGFIPTADWKKEKTGITWYPGDTYNISIGQGYMKATPLQLAIATSAIANGGKLYKPWVVSSILDKNNNIIKAFESELISQVSVDLNYLEQVRTAMRQTVLSDAGTARSLQWMPVSSAAKTGTAQTGKNEIYHNLITLFAPYENPEIVITIIIESVPYETGVANLLARQIMEYYFNPDKNKPKEEINNIEQENQENLNNEVPPASLPDGEGASN